MKRKEKMTLPPKKNHGSPLNNIHIKRDQKKREERKGRVRAANPNYDSLTKETAKSNIHM